MRTILTFLLAALVLLNGVTGSVAYAADATTAPTGACATAQPTVWERWGADPYAHSEAEAMRKLDQALADMVTAGCLPKEVADAFKQAVTHKPQGDTSDGGRIKIVPGTVFAFMESGKHPMLNVSVAERTFARGVVLYATGRGWAVMYGTKIYILVLPDICFNWAVIVQELPKPDCAEVRVPAKGPADSGVAWAKYYPTALAPSACDAFMAPGETAWRAMPTRCPEGDCVPHQKVNDMSVAQSGGWRVAGTGGEYRIRVSKEFARKGMLLLCLKRHNGTTSCGTKVQWDDYQDNLATVYYTQALAMDAKQSPRLLYWRFKGCLDAP